MEDLGVDWGILLKCVVGNQDGIYLAFDRDKLVFKLSQSCRSRYALCWDMTLRRRVIAKRRCETNCGLISKGRNVGDRSPNDPALHAKRPETSTFDFPKMRRIY